MAKMKGPKKQAVLTSTSLDLITIKSKIYLEFTQARKGMYKLVMTENIA